MSPSLEAERDAPYSLGNKRQNALRWRLSAGDLLAGACGGVTSALVGGLSVGPGIAWTVMVAVAWPGAALFCGLYSANDLRSWAREAPDPARLFFGALLLSWPLFATAEVLGAAHPATAALLATLLAPLLSIGTCTVARRAVHRNPRLRQRTLLIGSGPVTRLLVERLKANRKLGLDPVGMLDENVHQPANPDLPLLGPIDDLPEVLDAEKTVCVIIAFSRASSEQLLEAIRICRDRGVTVHVVPRLFEFLEGARLDHVGGLPLHSIGPHRLTRASLVAKRLLDLSVSCIGLVVLSPFLLAIAIAIKLDSSGSVLFRQVRVGRAGRVFQLLKFRSMRSNAEDRKSEFEWANDLGDGVMFKIHGDPRVTRVGALLRRFSLDELPQLINVFRGHMSLVGPRPLIPAESEQLPLGWAVRRLDLRPGMTGPWQVAGRSDIPFQDMIRFDYQYVAGWSLARDVRILLDTPLAVLSGRGAY